LSHLGIFDQMTARDISVRAKIHETKISWAVQKTGGSAIFKTQAQP